MPLKHVIVRNPRLHGWEYGMLRALEAEIVAQTQATVIDLPLYGTSTVFKKAGHGMRFEGARKLFPKKPLPIEADVIWYILMGPENHELDLFSQWHTTAKHRIVYLFDTLQPQFPLIRRLYSNTDFTIRITSFDDTRAALEQLTAGSWHAIEQAVPRSLFQPVEEGAKTIDFSSYGRRYPSFHDALLEFCHSNGLYYDYTMHDGRHPTASNEELYRQYAWHLSHSKFTISWPVELTSPQRAGNYHPVTCRWFEAASAGTVIVGRKPANNMFGQYFNQELVVDIDPQQDKKSLWKSLDQLYADRSTYLQRANDFQRAQGQTWTWTNRVQRMLALIP